MISNKSIRLIELFAGIGSQAMALRDIGANFTTYKVVEFDKYAIQSYNAIHNTNFNTLDITQINADDLEIVDTDKYNYILTYSFPCQDLSVAGKQNGMSKGSGTRSGLLWEVERLLNECHKTSGGGQGLPQILLMENVTQVHGKKNTSDFNNWLDFLESLGYKNYYQDLNAKDYGIPQNRNRCFMISKLNDNTPFIFPKPQPLEHPMRDYLEKEVDERYYLKKTCELFINNSFKQEARGNGFRFTPHVKNNAKIGRTITTRSGGRMDDNFIIDIDSKEEKFIFDSTNKEIMKRCQQVGRVDIGNNESNNRVYSAGACCPTLNTMQGGHRQPKILETVHKVLDIPKEILNDNERQRRVYTADGVCPSVLARSDSAKILEMFEGYKIRKLTPRECWRLMGFTDEDFNKAEAVCSNAQLYKQAGNSIVKNVLMAIFKELLREV